MGDPAPCTTIPLGALADAFEVLQALADEPFDGAAALAAIRLSQWAHPHYARYVAAREEAAAAHGEKVAEGRYTVPAENVAAYNQAMAPARAEAVEFDATLRIRADGLAKARISPLALATLRPFVVGI